MDPQRRLEWRALALQSRAGPFATPDWHDSVQVGFGDRGREAVLQIVDAGRLVGVAALRIHRRFAVTSVDHLGMGETSYGMADYGDLLAMPGAEAQVARATVDWLRAHGARHLDFLQVPLGPTASALQRAMQTAGFDVIIRPQDVCHRASLPDSWTEFRGRLSSKTRHWLEYYPRRIERDLDAVFETVPNPEILEEFARARSFLRERWGTLPDDRRRRWSTALTDWMVRARDLGWLRLFRLRVGQETVAVSVCFQFGDCLYGYNFTWDTRPELRIYSVGAVLISGCVRWAIENGVRTFDFLRGDYDYKRRLGATRDQTYRITGWRGPGLASLALIAMRRHRPKSGWRRLQVSGANNHI